MLWLWLSSESQTNLVDHTLEKMFQACRLVLRSSVQVARVAAARPTLAAAQMTAVRCVSPADRKEIEASERRGSFVRLGLQQSSFSSGWIVFPRRYKDRVVWLEVAGVIGLAVCRSCCAGRCDTIVVHFSLGWSPKTGGARCREQVMWSGLVLSLLRLL